MDEVREGFGEGTSDKRRRSIRTAPERVFLCSALAWLRLDTSSVIKPMNGTIPRNEARPRRDRWRVWLPASIALHASTFALYPAFICGCHFHPSGLVVATVPIALGAFMLAHYSLFGERLVAYANGALAVSWFYYVWTSNLQFLFY